jgi:hypothetical protein
MYKLLWFYGEKIQMVNMLFVMVSTKKFNK